MGWRGTILLILVVAVAGVYLWIAEPTAVEEVDDAPTLLGEPRLYDPSQFNALLPFQPGDVVAIDVVRGEMAATAKRVDGAWKSSSAPGAMDDFLRGLSELGRVMEIPTTAEALRDYGLEEPQAVVELTLTSPQAPLVLTVGAQNPAATGVYVRVDDAGPVILAGALLTWEIDKLFRRPSE